MIAVVWALSNSFNSQTNRSSGSGRENCRSQRVPILSPFSFSTQGSFILRTFTNSFHLLYSIARKAGGIILSSGGVIRGITNWGPFLLAKPKVSAQVLHDSGHHFIMRFDCSPKTQELVRKTVAIDPRMLRCGVVKLGGTLKEIMNVPGKVTWRRENRMLVEELGENGSGGGR